MKTKFIRMKKKLFILLLMMISIWKYTNAQSTEVQQLLLNVEKLSQLKNILRDMEKGYQVVSSGYTKIKNVAQGNFSLHELFLDGLLAVNPEIKKYPRVGEIISGQLKLVKEYKQALTRFKIQGTFNAQEIAYLEKVYKQVFDQSVQNLDDLLSVLTASKLRMSDEERLAAIDRIFSDAEDKLLFLRHFNREGAILSLARSKEKADLLRLQKLYPSPN